MSAKRYQPDDPREWLNRARSNLRLAALNVPDVYREELCYNAQQAAEKAIKAVFVRLGRPFPFTHNLAQLLEILTKAGIEVPADVLSAKHLTRFALEARYPGVGPEATEEEYQGCLQIARVVLRWAEAAIESS
jgi:HEPN domain-containing protein